MPAELLKPVAKDELRLSAELLKRVAIGYTGHVGFKGRNNRTVSNAWKTARSDRQRQLRLRSGYGAPQEREVE